MLPNKSDVSLITSTSDKMVLPSFLELEYQMTQGSLRVFHTVRKERCTRLSLHTNTASDDHPNCQGLHEEAHRSSIRTNVALNPVQA